MRRTFLDTASKAEQLWDLKTLVTKLKVKQSWVYDQTSRKKLPYRKIAGKLRFDPAEIDLWVAEQPGCSLKTSGNLVGRKD